MTTMKMIKFFIFILCIFGVLVSVSFWFHSNNYVINYTQSYPLGIYKKTPGNINKGDLVAFCLPENKVTKTIINRGYLLRGNCENGLMPLVKTIFAVEGDHVSLTDKGVEINDLLIVNTAPTFIDNKGRELPLLQGGIVKKKHLLLLSNYNIMSFDSRYFGIVEESNILYKLTPVYLLGGT